MNEIEKFNTEVIHLNDEFYERYERMKADQEWWETVKFKFKQFAEETGVNKWTTDRWRMSYIVPTKPEQKVDTTRMRNTNIEMVNAETGEVETVNAYEYFSKVGDIKSPYVKYEEIKE